MIKPKNIKYKNYFGAAIALIIVVLAFSVCRHIGNIGASIGQASGKAVGTAIGAVKGVTVGRREGHEAGEQAGLSAEDTTAYIIDSMETLGKLDVLVAGVRLKNINKIGDAYTGLSIISGDAVFSVDLSEGEISFSSGSNDVYITIPEPELTLYLDQSNTEKLAEIQKFSFSVSAKDGLEEYLNSMARIEDEVRETMVNYDSLMAEARETAIEQVRELAQTVCGDNYIVHVQFK